MRQYGSVRFAQLTLFIALTAGLLTATFTSNPPISPTIKFTLKVGGIITVIVFWIMEERAADYWHHFCRRAVELEKELGYQQYTKRPARVFITATNAVRLLYAAILVFWVASIIWSPCF
jgi:hypothetical protein